MDSFLLADKDISDLTVLQGPRAQSREPREYLVVGSAEGMTVSPLLSPSQQSLSLPAKGRWHQVDSRQGFVYYERGSSIYRRSLNNRDAAEEFIVRSNSIGDYHLSTATQKIYILDNELQEIYRFNLNNRAAGKIKVYTGLRPPRRMTVSDK